MSIFLLSADESCESPREYITCDVTDILLLSHGDGSKSFLDQLPYLVGADVHFMRAITTMVNHCRGSVGPALGVKYSKPDNDEGLDLENRVQDLLAYVQSISAIVPEADRGIPFSDDTPVRP